MWSTILAQFSFCGGAARHVNLLLRLRVCLFGHIAHCFVRIVTNMCALCRFLFSARLVSIIIHFPLYRAVHLPRSDFLLTILGPKRALLLFSVITVCFSLLFRVTARWCAPRFRWISLIFRCARLSSDSFIRLDIARRLIHENQLRTRALCQSYSLETLKFHFCV